MAPFFSVYFPFVSHVLLSLELVQNEELDGRWNVAEFWIVVKNQSHLKSH
jgi:hypothetical protein